VEQVKAELESARRKGERQGLQGHQWQQEEQEATGTWDGVHRHSNQGAFPFQNTTIFSPRSARRKATQVPTGYARNVRDT